jgi:hypothetical protein
LEKGLLQILELFFSYDRHAIALVKTVFVSKKIITQHTVFYGQTNVYVKMNNCVLTLPVLGESIFTKLVTKFLTIRNLDLICKSEATVNYPGKFHP